MSARVSRDRKLSRGVGSGWRVVLSHRARARRAAGRRHQPIAHAAHGLDVHRPVGVDLDLLAQPAHRDPDVGRVGVLGLGPAAGEERLGRDDLAEVRGERVEQPRFGRRQLDDLPADGRLAPVQVERQVRAQVQALAGDLVAEPAQDAVDARPELRVVIRLGDVVLGDLLEQVGLRVAGIDGGEHDDRQVGLGLDLAREGQAVHARHHHVDDQQVGPTGTQPTERLVPVARGRDLVAVRAQLVGEQDEQVRVVIDDEDPGGWTAAAQHVREYAAPPRTRESTDDGALVHRFSRLCGLVVQMGDDFRQQTEYCCRSSALGGGAGTEQSTRPVSGEATLGPSAHDQHSSSFDLSAVSAIDQSDPPAPRSCTRDRGPRGFRFSSEPDGSPSPTHPGVQGGLHVRFSRPPIRRSTSRCHPGLPARGFFLRARREPGGRAVRRSGRHAERGTVRRAHAGTDTGTDSRADA